jgi:GNAT superfamily N-acetyltransferase
MLPHRVIQVEQDRETLLEFHCRINYESETPYARRIPYETYRRKWLTTSQPESYLAHLAETMEDRRTLAEIWEQDGTIIGYLWVVFHDILDYDITIAEVRDLAVAPPSQRQGVGIRLLQHAEDVARKHGATLLRSDTGSENVASQRLHETMEYRPYRICYEKILRYPQAACPVPLERCAAALEEARGILRRHGYDHDISAEDLLAYAEADTIYPSAISWDEILKDRLILVHEVVEIAELKRMGLEITRNVIVQNLEEIYEAHLRAAEVEMAIALEINDLRHLHRRLKAVQDWIGDPLMPSRLRAEYDDLYARLQQAVRGA